MNLVKQKIMYPFISHNNSKNGGKRYGIKCGVIRNKMGNIWELGEHSWEPFLPYGNKREHDENDNICLYNTVLFLFVTMS